MATIQNVHEIFLFHYSCLHFTALELFLDRVFPTIFYVDLQIDMYRGGNQVIRCVYWNHGPIDSLLFLILRLLELCIVPAFSYFEIVLLCYLIIALPLSFFMRVLYLKMIIKGLKKKSFVHTVKSPNALFLVVVVASILSKHRDVS